MRVNSISLAPTPAVSTARRNRCGDAKAKAGGEGKCPPDPQSWAGFGSDLVFRGSDLGCTGWCLGPIHKGILSVERTVTTAKRPLTSTIWSPGSVTRRVYLHRIACGQHRHRRSRREDFHTIGETIRPLRAGQIPGKAPLPESPLPTQPGALSPSPATITPSGRSGRLAVYVSLRPWANRAACSAASSIGARSSAGSLPCALAQHATNWRKRSGWHSAQGRCPAASAVASSRKKSSV